MALGGWNRDTSPYHAGERELHDRMGRKDLQDRMGRQVHRPFMPDQHRTFFAQLPFVIVGSVDAQALPWASVIFGHPGFVSTPDDKSILIDADVIPGDPFAQAARAAASVSLLGIELPTRRRNRVNGVVREQRGSELLIDVVQSFGNCPQYIHARQMHFTREPREPAPVEIERFTELNVDLANVIRAADTFFVASYNDRDDKLDTGGDDVNHRGGRPGFVKVDGNTLTIPDYIGNFAFNTLGNFLVNPKAGLLFIDFETGDLIQLTGTVELMWDPDEEIKAFRGAERAWKFNLNHGHRLKAASPLRFLPGESSPNSTLTGDWMQVAQALQIEADQNPWRAFRVVRIHDESSVIRSFTLEPADDRVRFDHGPGQFLSLRVTLAGVSKPLTRTYTLSSAPGDDRYRISVKREGVVSTHLHQTIQVGDLIETRAPQGAFTMNLDERRPAVLLAGGVGVTPMISMARQASINGFSRRHHRSMTVFHAARTTAERAFADEFSALQHASNGQLRYVSIIANPASGERVGHEFHVAGRLNAEILQAWLPLADYDFYLCGPQSFMQSLYDALISLGVRDHRIVAEAFGPAALKRLIIQTGAPTRKVEHFGAAQEAVVTFERSGIEQAWTSSDGTLLEFAEAHGLSPNFKCRGGSCGSCAVRLSSGKVSYTTEPNFEVEVGKALICCSVPASSDEPLKIVL